MTESNGLRDRSLESISFKSIQIYLDSRGIEMMFRALSKIGIFAVTVSTIRPRASSVQIPAESIYPARRTDRSSRMRLSLPRAPSSRPVARTRWRHQASGVSRRVAPRCDNHTTTVPAFSRGCSACECAAVPRAAARDRRGLECARS